MADDPAMDDLVQEMMDMHLRVHIASLSKEDRTALKMDKLQNIPNNDICCRYFGTIRGCRFGDKCRYRHVKDPCREFGLTGNCSKSPCINSRSGSINCEKIHIHFGKCQTWTCMNKSIGRYCLNCVLIFKSQIKLRKESPYYVFDGQPPAYVNTHQPCLLAGCPNLVLIGQNTFCSLCLENKSYLRQKQ